MSRPGGEHSSDDRVLAWLRRQRDDLINMSRRNRLLYFKHTKTASLEIVRPAPGEVLRRLGRSGAWDFIPAVGSPSGAGRELAVADKDADQLEKALKLLERKANQEFVDKGVWVLYLGLGMLNWLESDDDTPSASPLLLYPVTIARDSLRESFRLRRTDDDPVLNPALAVKLDTEFGLVLPTVEEFEESGFESVMSQVEDLVAGKAGWSVSDRTVFSTFTFQKEAMYRDLLSNEELLVADPMIQLLAVGPDAPGAGSFDFDPVPEDKLDKEAPPEDLVNILDADASQRTCVLAARGGHSFVMDGPPGSGKSQTITNIIAELMHAGKTVLFVSEKAAALDVVHGRLSTAKLTDFVLQLHSHDANRKTVAQELGRALAQRPRAVESFQMSGKADLAAKRKALSSYAQTLNEIRQPLGRSLHQVLGAVAELHAVPQAPVPTAFGRSLTLEQYTRLRDTAATLGRAWGPVTRGEEFLWRDLASTDVSASRRKELDDVLENGRQALRSLHRQVEAVDDELGLGWSENLADARRLLELLTLLGQRQEISADWLVTTTFDKVSSRCTELADTAARHASAVAELTGLVGTGAAAIDPDQAARLDHAVATLGGTKPPWRPAEEAHAGSLRAVVEFLRASTATLDSISVDASRVSSAFGLRTAPVTLARAAELAELSGLVGTPNPPEGHWLNPTVQAALHEAARVLGELLTDYQNRRNALRTVFTDEVLSLDLHALTVRFTEVHRGLGKLRKAYRQDKRALAACTVTGRVDRTVRERLREASSWQELSKKLSEEEKVHAGLLGEHYYRREGVDFNRVGNAISVAHQALNLIGGELDGPAVAKQLGRGGSPDPDLPPLATRLGTAVRSWLTDARRLLGPVAEALTAMPIDRLTEWCAETADQLDVVVEVVDHVSGHAGVQVSLVFAEKAVGLAAHIRELRELVEGHADEDGRLLGGGFRSVDTDWAALRSALTWSEAMRAVLGGAVHHRVADAVMHTTLRADDLHRRLEDWLKIVDRIAGLFTRQRAEEVTSELHSDLGDAEEFLVALAGTVGDVEEWAAHVTARTVLEQAGLQPVVSFCAERHVQAEEVALVIDRALLEAWADDVLTHDRDRLGELRATDRNALVDEFQALDRAQIANAAARVINACGARRPSSSAGEAGIIKRQAELQRKHMPIRDLLDRAGRVVQLLKPCFMMSPLSVSQYLPPSLRFDVVIFDEASQVRPSDAVNCVYRGRQLVVAGDQKQLPPSSFFGRVGEIDDDIYDEDQIDDFESLLDLCKGAGALKSLPLSWHYRSEHESLITYSNYRFYDGGLLTFPGATHQAADVGVELFKVDGVYRRGGARDNPVEAAKVVDRILYHRHHHPNRTLGVVTFSGAQEDAIEREIEQRARRYPELAELHSDDRLNGFFVKNLENVQGDERDIIIFSVGYGPDENKKFTLNMGPLNKANGWRRLNVAITRAKRRVEIVTSVLADDFVGSVASDGLRHLRGYLDYAQRGVAALALDLEDSAGDAESPFEEEVLRAIRGWAYEAVPQVGVAGYRIDIGVRHPEKRGTYALGVECDGAMYHSSKVARDRDRLRQEVLEGLDWRIHRIWSTAWYRDRQAQEKRLRNAIEAAIAGRDSTESREVRAPTAPVVQHEAVELDGPPQWAVPYRLAEINVRTGYEMHEPEARGELRRLIEAVVRVEGPVHEARVLQAVREAWGKWKAGARMREAFEAAVRDLSRTAIQRDSRGFLKVRGAASATVRVPTDDDPRTEREVKHVPTEELRLAIRHLVADAHTITHDELSRHVARVFGWQRRGPDIRANLDDVTADLIGSGELHEENGELRTTTAAEQPAPVVPRDAPPRGNPRVPTLPAGLQPRRRPQPPSG
jgi:hypothetical protein